MSDDNRPDLDRTGINSPYKRRLLVLLLSSACGLSLPALAHDEADWIMKSPEYVDQVGDHCCGPDDCERIPESFIREEGLLIHVLPTRQVFRKGDRGVYPSRDTAWWWCKSRKLPSHIDPPAACIFFPFNGH